MQNKIVRITKVSGLSFTKFSTPISPGMKVTLVEEGENEYDPYAIRIEFKGEKVGYISKSGGESFKLTEDERIALFNSLKDSPQEVIVARANYAEEEADDFWAKPGELTQMLIPVTVPTAEQVDPILKCAITPAEVNFNEPNHIYTNSKGEVYLSGSVFAEQYGEDFNALVVAGRMANSKANAGKGIKAEDIAEIWANNNEANWGTLVHKDLENYILYKDLSIKLGKEYHLPNDPYRRRIVESYFKGKESLDFQPEVFVADADRLMCGSIDIVEWIDRGEKKLRIRDFKTNKNIHQRTKVLAPFSKVVEPTKLGLYWLQLSFYANIFQAKGYTVEGLTIDWYDGKDWQVYTHDVVDISKELN